MGNAPAVSPAEEASQRALAAVEGAIEREENFLLEAGAGAGKTYSLVKALHFLIEREKKRLPRQNQQVACITFTNVAKEEIEARTDSNPLIYCDTIHGFCWSLIAGFQKQLRALLPAMEQWAERIEEAEGIGRRRIEYTLGHRSVADEVISIHHDDVLKFTILLTENEKFRRIITNRYPIILIDEYQDTNVDWVDSVKEFFLGQPLSPQFGFFGDHWQKIYGDGCGKIEHPSLTVIGKEANFRSVSAIVECLNRMRPQLPQFVDDPMAPGEVRIFHTNNWAGQRQKGGHWGGDLPMDASHEALGSVVNLLKEEGWNLSSEATKILMLTHRVLASEQGYSSLPQVFRYNEAFAKKEHDHIAFFVDHLEPACTAFQKKSYGEMYEAIGGNISLVKSVADKARWAESMQKLLKLRAEGTVGDVIAHLRATRLPQLSDAVERGEKQLDDFDESGEDEMPRTLQEIQKLHTVPYKEIIALAGYLEGHSPFETKHGVKGAQFENVLVVIGRGWNQYNFREMLELARDIDNIPAKKQAAYERNRNLFYVACSRPKKRLAILFTQELSARALETVRDWFGEDSIVAIDF